MRQPMLDPERDLKGATPATQARALLRVEDVPSADVSSTKGDAKNSDERDQGNDADHCPSKIDMTPSESQFNPSSSSSPIDCPHCGQSFEQYCEVACPDLVLKAQASEESPSQCL